MADETTTINQTGAEAVSESNAQMDLRFQLLPEPLQKMIMDGTYNGPLINIAKTFKLSFEQLETLQLETVMALFGLSTLLEYRDALATELKKTDAEMEPIMKALNEQIFDTVKDSLQNFYATIEESKNEPDESGDVSEDSDSGSNPFAGSLDTAPVSPEPVANVVPIRTAYVAPAPVTVSTPVSASVSVPASVRVAPEIPIQRMQPTQTFTPAQPSVIKPVMEETLTSTEKNVLGNAGVVLGESQNIVSSPEDAATLNRTDLMQGIENPMKMGSSTIVASKLSTSSTLMPNKTTDYTLPRTSQPAPTVSVPVAKPGTDPYREIPQ